MIGHDRHRWVASAALLLALGTTACGDDGDDGDGGAGSTGTPGTTTMVATSSTSTSTSTSSGTSTSSTGSTSDPSSTSTTSPATSTTAATGTEDSSSSGGSSSVTGVEILSYAVDVEPIVLENCGAGGICHQNMAEPTGGLFMGEGAGYGNLVGVAASQVPELSRIEPGAPGQSYLVNKILGTAPSVGGSPAKMPLGGMLTDEEIRTFRVWARGGAQP